MIADPETRAFGPRQLYLGPTARPVVPVPNRGAHAPVVG
jgi:hypothetical protein